MNTSFSARRPVANAPWFSRTPRHAGIRAVLPAAIQVLIQNGILDRVFNKALRPEFLFPAIAQQRPWQGGLGDNTTFTRTGLLAPVTTAITGSDPSPATYGSERYSVIMEQYGNAMDTNMLGSHIAIQSKFLEDQEKLAINAGQSLNRIARGKLFLPYAGGTTWATTAAGSSVTLGVANVDGFTTVMNATGDPVAVSVSNPLTVTVNGVANTVTGVSAATGAGNLTLGSAISATLGWIVKSAQGAVMIRPATIGSARQMTAGNVATFAMFRAAVTRLRNMNVPTINGSYVAHIDPTALNELFDDADFKTALTGRVDSEIYRDLSIGKFAGIDWVVNNEAPVIAAGFGGASATTVDVHQSIVLGAGALVSAPLQGFGALLSELGIASATSQIDMVSVPGGTQVARILRAPADRLQQIVSSAWSWVGDYGVPSDSVTGDTATFKRAVVLEHA